MMPVQVLESLCQFKQPSVGKERSTLPMRSSVPLQLPVAQAVPSGVGLVPPAFPVSMGIPPPGYGPPPFIRPGFNASQPPPGMQILWNDGPVKVYKTLEDHLKPVSPLQAICRQHQGEACLQQLPVSIFDV